MAVPVVESYASAGESSSVTSLEVTKPTGTAEGDLLFARISVYTGTDPTIVLSGWTKLGGTLESPYHGSTQIFYKIAGGSEPSSYTFTWTSSFRCVAAISRISGVNTASPIDDYDIGTAEMGVGSSGDSPDITTTVDDCLILRSLCKQRDDAPAGVTGHTTQFSVDSDGYSAGPLLALAYESQVTAGSPGTATWTWGGTRRWTAATISIEPAGGGGENTGFELRPSSLSATSDPKILSLKP